MGRGPKYLLLAAPGRDKMSSGKISHFNFGCYLYWKGSGILVFGSSRAGKNVTREQHFAPDGLRNAKKSTKCNPTIFKKRFLQKCCFCNTFHANNVSGSNILLPDGLPNTKKSTTCNPTIFKKRFLQKGCFCNTFHAKNVSGSNILLPDCLPNTKKLSNSTPQSLKKRFL